MKMERKFPKENHVRPTFVQAVGRASCLARGAGVEEGLEDEDGGDLVDDAVALGSASVAGCVEDLVGSVC